MAEYFEITVIDEPRQTLETYLGGKSIKLAINYNAFINRWSFDLWIDGVLMVAGRRLILGANLLRPFDLGIGGLHVFDWQEGSLPGRSELPSGACRIYSSQ